MGRDGREEESSMVINSFPPGGFPMLVRLAMLAARIGSAFPNLEESSE